jgi:hypothetical protein
MLRREPRRLLLLGSLLVPLVLCAACGNAAAPAPGGSAHVVRITATPSGCPAIPARVPAGTVVVVATNLDAPTVSEVEVRSANLSRVLGEKENLIEGMTAKFTISLAEGKFVVNCPGAAESHWPLTAVRPQTKPSG